jgi:hypothetical protein
MIWRGTWNRSASVDALFIPLARNSRIRGSRHQEVVDELLGFQLFGGIEPAPIHAIVDQSVLDAVAVSQKISDFMRDS